MTTPLLMALIALTPMDTVKNNTIQEVIVIAHHTPMEQEAKPLTSLDHYLEKASAVNMIRRGNYAWEPFINGMGSERNVITIDGMRIYGACTDKMDPVTSYVEISNLAQANVSSGSVGSTGATIGGGLDLERKKGAFGQEKFQGTAFAGFESNHNQKIMGSALSYSAPLIFVDLDFTMRDAGNYRAGGGQEILYSQFSKYNFSAIGGFRLHEHAHLEASVIYDHAADVGYPALPMDVSVAKAFIGSIEYVRHHLSSTVNNWNTKIYFNDVTHQMDDTNRPEVPIRMDMPGWSETAGFYSELKGGREKNSWRTNLSGHWNSSLAEMTMFSNNSGERDMFMLTWPGVHTYYVDVFGEHTWQISNKLSATITGGLAAHQHHVKSEFGFESIQIFYPNVEKRKSRLLKRASSSMEYQIDDWLFSAELAYGERAPSVSEGYGFYLFNSFDQYDYIGNPHLSNEQSFSGQMGISYSISDFTAKLSASNFYIMNYILGRPKVGLSEMTIGAAGVKVYEQLSYANIINSALDMQYRFNEKLLWSGGVSYRRGKGKEVKYLPLIQPFSYQSELAYYQKSLSAKVGITGAAKHQHYNPEFGEQAVADYWTMNISVANLFRFGSQTWLLNAGIENVLDRQYTTFADWNRLPRMGRNLFVNLVYYF